MIAQDLEAACVSADLEVARGELLRAWVALPCERLARLVELIDAKRDAVLPYALANLGSVPSTKAAGVLAAIAPDPRVAPALLELFEKPPWRSNPSLRFWRAACERIVRTRDPRILARLEQVALGYPERIPTAVGHHVAGYLAKAARELRAAIDALPPFDARSAAACAVLEGKLGAQPAHRAGGVVDDLLAAVYEAPLDDAPRLVLADHLIERGDPRGDFIALQLARLAGRTDEMTRARELELLARSHGAWAGRIGMALEPAQFAYHRGFVAHAVLPRTKQTLAAFADDPGWQTLESIEVAWTKIVGEGDRAALAKIVDGSRGLRALTGVPAKFLADRAIAKLERLELELESAADVALACRWLAKARRPHTLAVRERPWRTNRIEIVDRTHVEQILEAPGFARLERFVLHTPQPQRWLERLEETALRVLVFAMAGLRVELVRAGDIFGQPTARQVAAHDRHRAAFTADPRRPEASVDYFSRMLGKPVVVDARAPFYPGLQITRPAAIHVMDDIAYLGTG